MNLLRAELFESFARFIDDRQAGTRLSCFGKFRGQGGDRLKKFEPSRPHRAVAPAGDVGDQNIEGMRFERGNLHFPADQILPSELFQCFGFHA